MHSAKLILFVVICALLTGCFEDITSSNNDKRIPVVPGSTGSQPGQIAAEFSIADTEGNTVTLSDELINNDGVVLYFSMWCPICDSHMSSLRQTVTSGYPGMKVLIVDYVSGTEGQARASQISSGYRDFTVLVDSHHLLTHQFNGDMGITVVINSDGTVLMNESFKLVKLLTALNAVQ